MRPRTDLWEVTDSERCPFCRILLLDHSSIGKELEVWNQRRAPQAGSESFPVNAIFQP